MLMYWMCVIGGILFIIGMIMLFYNIVVIICRGSNVIDELVEVVLL